MSRTYYHRHRRKPWHPPRWFTNLVIRRPERQATRIKLQEALRVETWEDLPDKTEFAEGNKPDANRRWD